MCWSTKSLWNNTHSVDPLWHTGERPSAPSVTQQVPPSDWITSYQNRHAEPHGSSWVHRGLSTCLIFSPANRDLSTLGTLPWWYSEPAPISASVPALCMHALNVEREQTRCNTTMYTTGESMLRCMWCHTRSACWAPMGKWQSGGWAEAELQHSPHRNHAVRHNEGSVAADWRTCHRVFGVEPVHSVHFNAFSFAFTHAWLQATRILPVYWNCKFYLY